MPDSEKTDLTTADHGFDAESLEREMDRLSLDQALRDFEIANARVIDLTKRLLEANAQIRSLTEEAHRARLVVQMKARLVELVKRSPFAGIAKKMRDRLRLLAR